MFFRDIHQNSIWPKSLVTAALVLSMLVSSDILFGNRLWPELLYNPYRTNGDFVRDSMLLACLAIYLLRVLVTIFVFFRRVMYWREALVIANIMPWCLIYTAYCGGQQIEPIGLIEVIGVLFFVLGSYLNSAGEYARHRWKMNPMTAEHLYTGGLFTYVRHINYTGDILLFSGIAFVAHQFGLLMIPLGMAFFFFLVLVPLKERYLRSKYGQEFEDYAAKTKMMIPMVV